MQTSLAFRVSGRNSSVDVKGYPACAISGHWPYAITGDWIRCVCCKKQAQAWNMNLDPRASQGGKLNMNW